MTDPTELAFRRAICDEPHDDTPRLVFSDWLEEQDTPESRDRAEFIRVQVRLAGMSPDDPELSQLQKREQKLFRKHKRRWHKGLHWDFRYRPFERGFPIGGSSTEYSRASLHKSITRNHPLVPLWRVALRLQPDWASWEGFPELRQVDLLDLGLTDISRPVEDYGGLADCPHLVNLTRLQIRRSFEGVNRWRKLLSEAITPRLRQLHVNDDRSPPGELIRAFAGSDAWPRLESLGLRDLSSALIEGRTNVTELARTPRPLGLRELDLSGFFLGDDGVEALLEVGWFDGLEALNLSATGLTDLGPEALCLREGLSSVKMLDLSQNMIRTDGARAIAESSVIANVERLALGRNPFTGWPQSRGPIRKCFGDRAMM